MTKEENQNFSIFIFQRLVIKKTKKFGDKTTTLLLSKICSQTSELIPFLKVDVLSTLLLISNSFDWTVDQKASWFYLNRKHHFLISALYNDIARLKQLIDRRHTNNQDESGYTALHYAARNNNLMACQLLIEANANVNAETKGGVTALQRAAMMGKF